MLSAGRALLFAAVIPATVIAACGDPAPPRPVAPGPAATERWSASGDGVVHVEVPVDLIVHVQEHAVMATSADGKVRLYVRHDPEETLIKTAGATKDALSGRGWTVVGERHFNTAIRLESTGRQQLHRVTWIIAREGRVVTCEAIVAPARQARLGDGFQRLCQGVRVTP